MSDQKIEKRRVLCDVEEVHVDSLPRSLRHIDKDDSLHEASVLVRFLVGVAPSFADKDNGLVEQGARGFEILLNLILDKIEIGRGIYNFPETSMSENAPALVEREEY
jgi:hypothetical protein